MGALTIRDSSRLFDLLDEIHLGVADLADIRFDAATGELVIPLRRWDEDRARAVRTRRRSGGLLGWLTASAETTWHAPWRRCFLTIRHVISWDIEDDARIGSMSFEDIDYDMHASTVKLVSGVPVTVVATVRDIEISFVETSEVLGTAEYRTSTAGSLSYSGNILEQDGVPPEDRYS